MWLCDAESKRKELCYICQYSQEASQSDDEMPLFGLGTKKSDKKIKADKNTLPSRGSI